MMSSFTFGCNLLQSKQPLPALRFSNKSVKKLKPRINLTNYNKRLTKTFDQKSKNLPHVLSSDDSKQYPSYNKEDITLIEEIEKEFGNG